MGEIQIFFSGICTFFENFSQYVPAEAGVHRMVLVDGNTSELTLGNFAPVAITPHLASVSPETSFEIISGTLPALNDAGSWPLNGVAHAWKIKVNNPSTPQSWTNNAGCLPSLQASLTAQSIGQPSLDVIRDGAAAAYVDFTAGTIVGLTSSQAGVSRVTVETDGNPQLRMETDGGPPAIVQFTTSTAVALISNKPPGTGDDQVDFLLNYLVVENPPDPESVIIPTTVLCSAPIFHLPIRMMTEAGPGCSNTNFP